jgi:hypothetical protein
MPEIDPRRYKQVTDDEAAQLRKALENDFSPEEVDTILNDPELRLRASIAKARRRIEENAKAGINRIAEKVLEKPQLDEPKDALSTALRMADPVAAYGSAAIGGALGGFRSGGIPGAVAGGVANPLIAYLLDRVTGNKPQWDSAQNILNLSPNSLLSNISKLKYAPKIGQAVGSVGDNILATGIDNLRGGIKPTSTENLKDMGISGAVASGLGLAPAAIRKGFEAAAARMEAKGKLLPYRFAQKSRGPDGRFISDKEANKDLADKAESLVTLPYESRKYKDALKEESDRMVLESVNTSRQRELEYKKAKKEYENNVKNFGPAWERLNPPPSIITEYETSINRPITTREARLRVKETVPKPPALTKGEELAKKGIIWERLSNEEKDIVKKIHAENPLELYRRAIKDLFESKTFADVPKSGEAFKNTVQTIAKLEGDSADKTILPQLRRQFVQVALEPKYSGSGKGYSNPDSLKKIFESTGRETIDKLFEPGFYDEMTKVLSTASRLGTLGKLHAKVDASGFTFARIPVPPKQLFTDSRTHAAAKLGVTGGVAAYFKNPHITAALAGMNATGIYRIGWDKFAEAVLKKENGGKIGKFFIDNAENFANMIQRRGSEETSDYLTK